MARTIAIPAIMAFLSLRSVKAVPDFKFCNDEPCTDCPVTIASEGTGYPNCVIYDSDDVFANQGFSGSKGGGTTAYLDIPDPGDGCYIIVRSPADTTMAGCGIPIGTYSQATCSELDIKETFMVQFCCGTGDCTAAGAEKRSAKFRASDLISRTGPTTGIVSIGGFVHPNGTEIQPLKIGIPPEQQDSKRAVASPDDTLARLKPRAAACTAGSWVPDENKDEYTQPASTSQVVSDGVTGGSQVQITTSRESSFSQSIMAGLNFADIVNIGVSFTLEESITDSKAYTFNVPDGESGNVDWTAFLMCSTGTGQCNGGSVHGQICTPYKFSSGELAGEYSVIATS